MSDLHGPEVVEGPTFNGVEVPGARVREERRSDGEAIKLPPKPAPAPARDDEERAPAREERFG